MNKIKKIFVGVVLWTTLLVFVINAIQVMQKETVSMYADEAADPQNPSRGYYVQMDSKDPDRLEKYGELVRLCLLAYDLYEFRDREISADKLKELEIFLQEAKKQNIKCIFRAAYGFDREEVNDAQTKELIEKHIRQIAEILNVYKEQIYCVQAGFFGPWGEWHSSIYLEEDKEAKLNRNWLLEQLLTNLDDELVINVRRPRFLRDALNAGLDKERLGLHNDALLSTDSDMGTYDDEAYGREEELEWMADNLLTVCNGGEMPQTSRYTDSKNTLKEFGQMQVSYLNLKYNTEVYEQWQEEKLEGQNAFSYISKRLGYRYYISEVTYPKNWYQDIRSLFQILEVEVVNEGFADIGESYVWEWVIEDDGGELHFFEVEEPVMTEKGQRLILELHKVQDISIERIGIRISERYDVEKKACNCVEFVGEKNDFEGGINYFYEF